MYCNKCKVEMGERTSEGDKYYVCSQCGDVQFQIIRDKKI